eukprot:scaffold30246_cov72-Skeletonema_dohrnii-CCMP3373.AAC.1
MVEAIDLDENENAAAVLAAGRSVTKRSVDTITFVWRRLLLLSDANFMEDTRSMKEASTMADTQWKLGCAVL